MIPTTNVLRIPTRLGELSERERGEGEPLVFWHSLFVDGASCDRVLPHVSAGRRTFVLDGPDHGRSGGPPGRTPMISRRTPIPVSGWIADRYGTRWVFFTAIGIFSLGSLVCGLSVNMPMLVGARILQGCGGALMMPVGRITMVRTFPRSELVRAMSFVAVPGLIGPLLDPLAGGLIVDYLHWRMIFFVNLPIGLMGMYLVFRHMPNYRSERGTPIDFVGLVLFGSGIALLSYVREVFGENELSAKGIVFLLCVSALLLLAYGRHALGAEYPLLKLRLFRIDR